MEAIVNDPENKILTPEGAMEIVGKSVLTYISVLAPEKIVIYSVLTPDMDHLREYLRQYVAEEYIPELVHVRHLKEYMIPGAMIHALEVLQNDPDQYGTSDFVRILKEVQKTVKQEE